MTDPTPNRAEVEAFRPEAIIPSSDTVILPKSQFKRWCENYQASLRAMEARHFAEEAALRERAEAAERTVATMEIMLSHHNDRHAETEAALTEARRAEAAAWEAAAVIADEHAQAWGLAMGTGAMEIAKAIRRAAPTEGEA